MGNISLLQYLSGFAQWRGNKNKMLFGVGVNDADYRVEVRSFDRSLGQILVFRCPFYQVWRGMLRRCYDSKLISKHPTYSNCQVAAEWLTFSKFKFWMETQNWEGKQLDKDLLVPGNKIYSPATCVFISPRLNTFIIERGADRGEYPIGVYFEKESGKLKAQISNPFTKKNENLGRYSCPQEAHAAWLKRKLELAKLLAAEQDDPRVAEALIERYENYKS